MGNSAPGLDAVSEIQVLSNSYSAEYGGLAGVVITTKRGGSQYRGTSFYDFNNDSLNALTYNQTLAGVERGDPLSDTHEHRWGGSLGGPLIGGKLFFFANYEGSNDKAIYGGSRANVPTEAMRAGDFRGTAINPIDPETGAPFPDQMIPAGRIDPAAQSIMEFFYPLPNRGTLANGYGIFQQFVPQTRKRHRADVRVDAEVTQDDSLFFRGSLQHRDPNNIIFEGGNAFTNLPTLDTQLNTAIGDRRMDEDSRRLHGQRVPGGLQLRQLEAPEHIQSRGRRVAAGHRERAEPRGRSVRVSLVHVHRGDEPSRAHEHCRCRDGTWTARCVRTPFLSATTSRGSAARTRSRPAASGPATWRVTGSGSA